MAGVDLTYVIADSGAPLEFDGFEIVWAMSVLPVDVAAGFADEQYQTAMLQLLPVGPAWPRAPDSAIGRVLLALAQELARVDARSAGLVRENDPRQAVELLADWERVFGLPDPCVEVAQSVLERQIALHSRVASRGDQNKQFFIDLAARLGYSITIEEFASAAAATLAGIPFIGDGWAHTWRVNVSTSTAVRWFSVGSGSVGDALRTWGNDVFECQFQRFKPAHTAVLFAYAS